MLCFETICVENRALKNLHYHEARLNKTRAGLWNATDHWDLNQLLIVPDSIENGLYKCRLSYSDKVEEIKWEPYIPRLVQSLRKVYADDIDYIFKYNNRQKLNELFAQRESADEVLIIQNGMVTDTSIANVAFFDGEQWFTPETFLLPGTQRAALLSTGVIAEKAISEKDISLYTHIRLFNAMNDWERAPVLEVSRIL